MLILFTDTFDLTFLSMIWSSEPVFRPLMHTAEKHSYSVKIKLALTVSRSEIWKTFVAKFNDI